MSRDNKFNHIKYSVIAIFIVTLSGVPAYFFWHSKKAAAVTEQKTKAETEQDFALAADKLFANKKITEIKMMKHIWELAPFVGRNIQLYGRAVVYLGWKNDPVVFRVSGKSEGIRAGCSKEWLKKQQVPLIQDGNNLISPFMLMSGRIIFDYLDMNNPESTEFSSDSDIPGGSWKFTDNQIIKVYNSPPPESERPADVSPAPAGKAFKEQFKNLFYGLAGDADITLFAHYVSTLEEQKDAEIKSGKAASPKSDKNTSNFDGSKLDEINFLSDLIPFVGSRIELKGTIEKAGDHEYYIVLNNKKRLILPIIYYYQVEEIINKTVLIKGNLLYFNNGSKKSFSYRGEIILWYPETVKVLTEKEIHDDSIPCIKEVPDFITSRARKSFINGYYQDADEISFRNFIINMMKEKAAEKNNPHRPH